MVRSTVEIFAGFEREIGAVFFREIWGEVSGVESLSVREIVRARTLLGTIL